VINLNALPALLWMLDNAKKNIRKEACWTISNITAGTSEQVWCVVVCCWCVVGV
jgi:importin subunit alpha-1